MESFESFLNTALFDPLQIIGQNVLALLPNILGMVVVIFLGGLISWFSAQTVERLFRVVRFDLLCQRVGLTAALNRGGVKSLPSYLAGRIVLWVVLSFFVIVGLAVLRLDPVNKLTSSLIAYIPIFLPR